MPNASPPLDGGSRSVRVLLVYPRTPDTFWSLKHALRFISKRSAFPALGLLTVAAMLPCSWQVKLVDENVDSLRDADMTCVVGEAEGLMDELTSDMAASRVKPLYEATARPAMSAAPVPRWDLTHPRHYATVPVQFSRGCPHDCEFCDIVAVSGDAISLAIKGHHLRIVANGM